MLSQACCPLCGHPTSFSLFPGGGFLLLLGVSPISLSVPALCRRGAQLGLITARLEGDKRWTQQQHLSYQGGWRAGSPMLTADPSWASIFTSALNTYIFMHGPLPSPSPVPEHGGGPAPLQLLTTKSIAAEWLNPGVTSISCLSHSGPPEQQGGHPRT